VAAASGGVAGAEVAAAALVVATPGGGLAAPPAALRRLAPRTAAFLRKFRRLNAALAEVIEDFNLVSFTPVSAADAASVVALLAKADHAMGYVPTAPARAWVPDEEEEKEAEEEAEEEEEEKV
jgi:hypothetical protein